MHVPVASGRHGAELLVILSIEGSRAAEGREIFSTGCGKVRKASPGTDLHQTLAKGLRSELSDSVGRCRVARTAASTMASTAPVRPRLIIASSDSFLIDESLRVLSARMEPDS